MEIRLTQPSSYAWLEAWAELGNYGNALLLLSRRCDMFLLAHADMGTRTPISGNST